jgi:hypothetical protein
MSGLGDDFRKRSKEWHAEAEELFGSKLFGTDRKTQSAATVAKITANMLTLLGEVVDYLRASEAIDGAAERRKTRAERFNELRKAFIDAGTTGDYTDYERIVGEIGRTLAGGQDGDEGGSGE